MSAKKSLPLYTGRYGFLLILLLGVAALIIWRIVDLTVIDREFLKKQGEIRSQRILQTPAYRGMITDRNGEPLAISTPVDAVWVNPQDFHTQKPQLRQLAKLLQMSTRSINKKLKRTADKEFVYLKRGVDPQRAKLIKGLKIPGLYIQREFRRFYPEGEVTAHILGFTDIDDKGVEGMELAYNDWLTGRSGKKRVLKDRLGHIIANVETLQEPIPGHNLTLSIDRRIQYLTYRAISSAVHDHAAESGSIVVLDTRNGEILAMANAPAYNPNDRRKARIADFRNRALTDVFEPGSAIKAFSIATALSSGKFKSTARINTAPGRVVIDGNVIRDAHNNGIMSLTEILQRSSNVGISKMILALPSKQLWDTLREVGFGMRTGSGFPGESSGRLTTNPNMLPFVHATLAFGYGMSVTPTQLAHAYSVFANRGKLYPLTLLHNEGRGDAKQVMNPRVAKQVLHMLEAVVKKHGTGVRAKITGYAVAGKTSTSRIVGPNGYEKDHHIATFVGIAPVDSPRLVVVVVIRDPQQGGYYGGVIAAPVFANVMQGALRILHVVKRTNV